MSRTQSLTLFPYTTLFRSVHPPESRSGTATAWVAARRGRPTDTADPPVAGCDHSCGHRPKVSSDRSEEHTSELQSRPQLVCRLLLAKKKNYVILDAEFYNG